MIIRLDLNSTARVITELPVTLHVDENCIELTISNYEVLIPIYPLLVDEWTD